jgi:hypothetical protein
MEGSGKKTIRILDNLKFSGCFDFLFKKKRLGTPKVLVFERRNTTAYLEKVP